MEKEKKMGIPQETKKIYHSSAEVAEVIKKKMGEHQEEIIGCESLTLTQQKAVLQIKEKGASQEKLLTETAKLGTLKDKALFHKACIATLADLLEEIS